MIHLKVHRGTVATSAEDQCATCYHATRMRYEAGEPTTYCNYIEKQVFHKVTECSTYQDKRLPSISSMEKLAWILRTDPAKKQIGFMPSKEYYKEYKEDPWGHEYNDPVVKKLNK